MDKQVKSERFELRVTPEEKKRLVELASTAGLSVAAYIIGSALGGLAGDKIVEHRKRNRG